MQVRRTAGIAADYIEKLGYAVTRAVGATGVVGLLRNGDGPTMINSNVTPLWGSNPPRQARGLSRSGALGFIFRLPRGASA